MRFVNLTPHPITVRINETGIIFPPSGQVARVSVEETPAGEIEGIPTIYQTFGEVEGIPEPQEGVFYLVSLLAFQASQRRDILAPDTGKTCIRDAEGRIVAATRFIRK